MCHYTRIPIPWYPYPYTHGTPYLLPAYIHAFVYLFIYLIVFVSLTLLFSLVLSPLALALPPWQGLPLGRGSRSYLSCMYQCFILFNYYPVVHMYSMYVCIYMYCILCVCIHHLLYMYPTDVCMYIVYCVRAVLCMYSSIHTMLYSMDHLCMVCP